MGPCAADASSAYRAPKGTAGDNGLSAVPVGQPPKLHPLLEGLAGNGPPPRQKAVSRGSEGVLAAAAAAPVPESHRRTVPKTARLSRESEWGVQPANKALLRPGVIS